MARPSQAERHILWVEPLPPKLYGLVETESKERFSCYFCYISAELVPFLLYYCAILFVCCYENDSQHFITHDHESVVTLLRVTTAAA